MNKSSVKSRAASFKNELEGDSGRRLVASLALGLAKLAYTQSRVSESVPGCIPENGDRPTKDAVRSYVLALFVELGEFLQELDWKPWKNGKKIDKERVADEFADILAFLGVVMVHLEAFGIDEADLAKAYRMKSVTNLRRFLGELGEEYDQTLDINTMSLEELNGEAYLKTFGVPPGKIGPLPQPPLPGMEDVA